MQFNVVRTNNPYVIYEVNKPLRLVQTWVYYNPIRCRIFKKMVKLGVVFCSFQQTNLYIITITKQTSTSKLKKAILNGKFYFDKFELVFFIICKVFLFANY